MYLDYNTYRIDATVGKLDSNHQAYQTKTLQRPEEDNIVVKTHRCSIIPTRGCTDATLDTRARFLVPLIPFRA